MQANLRKIIKKTEDAKLSTEAYIATLGQEITLLRSKEDALEKSLQALKKIYSQNPLDGKIITRKELFEMLRKKAVVQQSISLIELDQKSVRQNRIEKEQEKETELSKLRQMIIMLKKYGFLLEKIRHAARMRIEAHEENEQEEIFYGKRNSQSSPTDL